MTIDEQIKSLESQLQQIDKLDLKNETSSSSKFVRWREATKRRIKKIFGEESPQFDNFVSINFDSWVAHVDEYKNRQVEREFFLRGLNRAKTELLVLIDELNEKSQQEEISPSKTQPDKSKQLQIEMLQTKKEGLCTEITLRYKVLNHLSEQDAKYGPLNVPLHVKLSIEEEKNQKSQS